MKDSDDKHEPFDLDKVMNNLTPCDFDGHTAFSTLSPLDKLNWLAQASAFVLLARQSKIVEP